MCRWQMILARRSYCKLFKERLKTNLLKAADRQSSALFVTPHSPQHQTSGYTSGTHIQVLYIESYLSNCFWYLWDEKTLTTVIHKVAQLIWRSVLSPPHTISVTFSFFHIGMRNHLPQYIIIYCMCVYLKLLQQVFSDF